MSDDPVVFDDRVVIGNLDLGPLRLRWRKVELMYKHAVRVRDTRDPALLTSRRVDESRPGGHRLYAAAERNLSAAWDCHAALPVVLNQHGATQSAMWTLLRSQFECSFYALWLLDPAESAGRVLRGIQLEWLSAEQSRKYYTEILNDSEFPITDDDRASRRKAHATQVVEHAETYAAECSALGVHWKKPPDVNVTEQLGNLSTASLHGTRPSYAMSGDH